MRLYIEKVFWFLFQLAFIFTTQHFQEFIVPFELTVDNLIWNVLPGVE
jgi:hypothetical protein